MAMRLQPTRRSLQVDRQPLQCAYPAITRWRKEARRVAASWRMAGDLPYVEDEMKHGAARFPYQPSGALMDRRPSVPRPWASEGLGARSGHCALPQGARSIVPPLDGALTR